MIASGFGGFTGAFVNGTRVGGEDCRGGIGVSVGNKSGSCVEEGRATGIVVGDDTVAGAFVGVVGVGRSIRQIKLHNDAIIRKSFDKNFIVPQLVIQARIVV